MKQKVLYIQGFIKLPNHLYVVALYTYLLDFECFMRYYKRVGCECDKIMVDNHIYSISQRVYYIL